MLAHSCCQAQGQPLLLPHQQAVPITPQPVGEHPSVPVRWRELGSWASQGQVPGRKGTRPSQVQDPLQMDHLWKLNTWEYFLVQRHFPSVASVRLCGTLFVHFTNEETQTQRGGGSAHGHTTGCHGLRSILGTPQEGPPSLSPLPSRQQRPRRPRGRSP